MVSPRIRRLWTVGSAVLAALGFAAAPGAADAATVLGQWRFDEATGSQRAIDEGPFGLDGRLGSSDGADALDPVRIPGLSGGGLRFDGRSFVRLPTSSELAPATLSVEAVVRASSPPGRYRYIISRGASACLAGSYGLYSGEAQGIAFYIFDGSRYIVSATAAPEQVWDGRWHHVVGTFDGTSLRLYVDGRPVGDPQPAPLTIAYGLTSSDTYLGMYRGSCQLGLRADLDMVRIWSGALSPGDAAGLSAAAFGTAPPASPPDPVPPAAPGTTIPAPHPRQAPPSAPGAPPRACVVSASAKRKSKRHVVSVRVRLRGKPLSRARVVATRGTKRTVIGSARTGRNGKASMNVKRSVVGRVSVSVRGRTDCASASVRLKR